MTKFMTDHRRMPSKKNVVCSLHVSLEPTIERSLIIEMEEKPDCPSASMVLWHGYRDYRGFSRQSPWMYWLKKLVILTSWGTGQHLLTCHLTTFRQLIGRFQNRINIIFLRKSVSNFPYRNKFNSKICTSLLSLPES